MPHSEWHDAANVHSRPVNLFPIRPPGKRMLQAFRTVTQAWEAGIYLAQTIRYQPFIAGVQ
ncbi:MAG: hypothetical protein ACRENW_04875 [Thermodesulfobacteriota bacterium]